MKSKIAFLLLFLGVLNFQLLMAQEERMVSLTVSGQGKTLEEAKHSALRNAIEQAFGAFISSKTEILNDDLVKDEIVSISNGNIHSVEVISEVQISEGRYATTLKTTVSVTKLTSFVTSKGVEVEFKGSLFAFNINQQKLNEKNEVKAIEDLCEVIRTLADNSFNYTLHTSNPISIDGSNEQWKIPMYISVYANSNIYNISKYMNTTLKGISLSNIDANNYMNLGKKVFPISFAASEKDYNYILLRNEQSVQNILRTMYYFNHALLNFKISNGLQEWAIAEYPTNIKYIYDYAFRLFIKIYPFSDGIEEHPYCKASVFYKFCSPRDNCNVGMAKEILEVNVNGYYNCDLAKNVSPILNYSKWLVTESRWNGVQEENLTGLNISDFYTELPCNLPVEPLDGNSADWRTLRIFKKQASFFNKQFLFVEKLHKFSLLEDYHKIRGGGNVSKLNGIVKIQKVGVVISFIGINEKTELVRFYYDDMRGIDEINKITEYKIIQKNN